MKQPRGTAGFTLVEILLGGLTLATVTAAILGAYVGQVTLNEHARNLALAIQDANRVIEQIRQQNAACLGAPPSVIPTGVTSWNAWLEAQAPGKSLGAPTPNINERIVVTCSHRNGPASGLCGQTNQVGSGEWAKAAGNSSFDPLRVVVTVCWRHRNRTIGECGWDGALNVSAATDTDADGTIESPAMLTTLVTCRG